MKKYSWFVFTSCDPDHVAEFNSWYDDVHLADLLTVPGIVGARRFKLSDQQVVANGPHVSLQDSASLPPQLPYVAIYDIETDNIAETVSELSRRAGDGMEISPYLRDSETKLFELP